MFDALNDIDQLEVGINAVHKAGGVVEGTVCYSGDSKLLEQFFVINPSGNFSPCFIFIELPLTLLQC